MERRGEDTDRRRRTEFDEKHAVALLLIRGQDNDAGEIIVVIGHFLLRAARVLATLLRGRTPVESIITFEKKPRTWSRCESASVRI